MHIAWFLLVAQLGLAEFARSSSYTLFAGLVFSMDPISIAASIVGLLIAASEVSESLNTFIRSVRRAPRLAHDVLREVSDIRACLKQLERYLSNRTTAGSQARLLLLEDIIIILSDCVITFAELEKVVEPFKVAQPMHSGQKARWIFKEPEIQRFLGRLKESQASLNFMLTMMTW